jgi:hypothetical protein
MPTPCSERFTAAVLLVALAMILATMVMLRVIEVEAKPQIVVVSPCAELDRVGYSGVTSCINEQGDVVRPGES